MTDTDLIVVWRPDRRPVVMAVAQQTEIRALFADGASDGEIAAAMPALPSHAISRIRSAMKLARHTPAGGYESSGAPKHTDGFPRMIITEAALSRAYAGRRYGPS